MGAVLDRMVRAIRHRGPDGQGFVGLDAGARRDAPALDTAPDTSHKVFFGHCRLSIIDPEGTPQPLRNEDGSVWVVFNGEIYNYRELVRNLTARGHHLREKGDTEVLVHLWEERGEAMVDELRGMFSLALYDIRQDVLFLARDRFGEKPLYYLESPEVFAFASELPALRRVPGFSDSPDDAAIAQFFRYNYIPAPATAYRGVSSLPAGHALTLKGGRIDVRPYWIPRVTSEQDKVDLDELSALIDDAVISRMMADVPLGCFLSGGLDSSLIAASMAKAGNGPIKAFTVSVGQGTQDESGVAARIAAHIGACHQISRAEPDFARVMETLAGHFGQPFADVSVVPTYLVSRETRREVKVALSGDGGDELFCGYDRYANAFASMALGAVPRPVRTAGAHLLDCLPGPAGLRFALSDFLRSACPLPAKGENHGALFHSFWRHRAFTPCFAARLLEAGQERVARFTALYTDASSEDPVARWMEADQRMYLADDILTKVDVASMAVSLETRAPFLDHHLAEYANRMSVKAKLVGRMGKKPLRDLAALRLPPEVAGLPKAGFTVPLATWLRGELRDWCCELIFDKTDAWEPYLRPEAVRGMWDDHQRGSADHAMRLWLVAVVALWGRAAREEHP